MGLMGLMRLECCGDCVRSSWTLKPLTRESGVSEVKSQLPAVGGGTRAGTDEDLSVFFLPAEEVEGFPTHNST